MFASNIPDSISSDRWKEAWVFHPVTVSASLMLFSGVAGGLTEEEIRTFKEQQQAKGSETVGKVLAQNVSRPRSAPYPCPPLSPWRNACGANGTHHLANLDVGSYGSKLSDSDSEPE